MVLRDLLKEKKMTQYQLSKKSGVPQTSVNDLCSGKTKLRKCSAEKLYRIAKTLDISIEEMIEREIEEEERKTEESKKEHRCTFELYKSAICHQVKREGDFEFIRKTLVSNEIRRLYDKKWYPECFYLLAMVDYLSKEHDIPTYIEYNDIRKYKLEKPVFPSGILLLDAITGTDDAKQDALKDAIPEFLKYNIVEGEIRNVV